jgi:hypothetical protein
MVGETKVIYKSGKVVHTGKPVHLADKETQHKFNPVTHKENKIPLWTSITAVNRELAEFARNNDNVVYFDVAQFFTEQDGKGTVLKSDLITSFGIPTEEGYRVWETEVASKAQDILNEL